MFKFILIIVAVSISNPSEKPIMVHKLFNTELECEIMKVKISKIVPKDVYSVGGCEKLSVLLEIPTA